MIKFSPLLNPWVTLAKPTNPGNLIVSIAVLKAFVKVGISLFLTLKAHAWPIGLNSSSLYILEALPADVLAELIYGLNPSRYLSHSSPVNDDLKSASELADGLTKLKIWVSLKPWPFKAIFEKVIVTPSGKSTEV